MSTVEGQKTVVVIGNGMVGHKFCEKLVELDVDKQFKITSFCEEKKTAYNRMRLTEVHSMLPLPFTALQIHISACTSFICSSTNVSDGGAALLLIVVMQLLCSTLPSVTLMTSHWLASTMRRAQLHGMMTLRMWRSLLVTKQ
jgi:hypothetical protein